MAGGADEGTIVVKKVINVAAAHHGGSWKVAYADFVTAMMAFFLLLWLLNVTSAEQRQGIADYFAPSAVSFSSASGAGGMLAGKSMAEEGARASASAPPVVTFEITAPKGEEDEDSRESKQAGDSPPDSPVSEVSNAEPAEPRPPSEAEIQRKLAEQEQALFEETRANIVAAITELDQAEASAASSAREKPSLRCALQEASPFRLSSSRTFAASGSEAPKATSRKCSR